MCLRPVSRESRLNMTNHLAGGPPLSFPARLFIRRYEFPHTHIDHRFSTPHTMHTNNCSALPLRGTSEELHDIRPKRSQSALRAFFEMGLVWVGFK
jgi:hypothetical protein